jgi:hypothetical protein
MRYNILMDQLMTTIPAHYDGTEIMLDVPIHLAPNTRLLVTVLDPAPPLLDDVMAASAASLNQVWNNDEDAVYDAY